jgi:phage FluMu protein Com
MESMTVVTCPRCSNAVRVASLGLLPRETDGGESGNVLKHCPRCKTWSWMTLQTQEA